MQQHKLDISQVAACGSSAAQLCKVYSDTLETVDQLRAAIEQLRQIREQVQKTDVAAIDYQLMLAFEGLFVILFQFLQMKPEISLQLEQQNENFTEASLSLDAEPNHELWTRKQPGSSQDMSFSLTEYGDIEQPAAEIDSKQGAEQPEVETGLNLEQCDVEESDEKFACWAVRHQLELKLLTLKDTLHKFVNLIEKTTVDINANPNVTTSTQEADKPTSAFHLPKVNLKLLMMPVAGAVLGGTIAGPVGLVAGLKVGKLAAISGGLIGLTGGALLKKHNECESFNRAAGSDAAHNEANELAENNPLKSVM